MPGEVKTRLWPEPAGAAALYRCFVEDLLASHAGGPYRLLIAVHPPDKRGIVKGWLGTGHEYFAQEGRDLGERMRRAFERAFREGSRRVLVAGSDCPDLKAEIVSKGFKILRNKKAVLGPSADGGYYMIGFQEKGFHPGVFEGVEWSTDGVFAATLERFREASTEPGLLPELNDLDRPEDLVSHLRRSPADAPPSRTVNLLKQFLSKM